MNRAWLALVFAVSTAYCGGLASASRAAEPPSPSPAGQRPPEILEMLLAVAQGSQMGPGDGWFHASQTRYDWNWLAARYDPHHKGSITREAFAGPPSTFERLDRNHDGVLTAADFDWSERSSYARQSMPSRFWFSMADKDSNGRLSRDEWHALFTRAAKGKDYLTADDLAELFPVSPPPREKAAATPANAGPSPWVLFRGLLSGELGSFREGPELGQPAPDFSLATQDGKRHISLSEFRGKKPVVLVFGSFT